MTKRKVIRKETIAVDDRTKAPRIEGEVRLEQIALVSCFAHRQFLLNDRLPQNIKSTIDVSVVLNQSVDLLVANSFLIEGRFDDTPDTASQVELPLLIGATIEVRYSIENLQSLSADDLAAFSKRGSLVHAWPYWREFVSSTTTRLGLPAMVVPLLKHISLTRENSDAEMSAANN